MGRIDNSASGGDGALRSTACFDLRFLRLAVFAITVNTATVAAQPGPCDPDLIAPSGNPFAYRLRGERCEGIYVQQVSSSALVMASFTSVFEPFAANNEELRVQWDGPERAEVRLRARTLDRRLHYRMDATRIANAPPVLSWPAALLHSLEIRPGNLGLLAWVPSGASPIGKDLYLPARVLGSDLGPAARSLRLALLPGVELSEVYVSLAPWRDGKPGAMIRDGEALRYGYYPADRSIEVTLPAPDWTGIFYLELAGTLRSGGSVTLPIWFYNFRAPEVRPSAGKR
jgi:hypothetical protein